MIRRPLPLPFNRLHHALQENENSKSSKANELGLSNVGGVFVVLLAGMGLASVVAVCEFVWKSRKLATEEHVSGGCGHGAGLRRGCVRVHLEE